MAIAQSRPDTGAAHAAWLRALELTAPIGRGAAPIFPVLIDQLALKFGFAAALLSEDERWSYAELAQRMNRYARWALGQGIGRGDVICLVMPNCPDYLAIWLGLTRVGGIVALVNTKLAGEALARAIGLVAPSHIIIGTSLVLPQLAAGIRCWTQDEIARDSGAAAGDPLTTAECAAPALSDRALLVYTSGTSGFPKAATVSHRRIMEWTHWFAGMMNVGPSDRMYDCLPMYHSVGGIVAVGAMLVGGGSVVLRPRFSASQFWDDVARWDCTIFQYIGELCRYLARAPAHPLETRHRIRLCCGNGLAADIWESFQERFRIPQILEFYAATEGALSLYNCEGKAGAIGRIPPVLAHRSPVALIRLDPETGEPARNAEGYCLRCSANEPGEALGRLGASDTGRFEGYTDRDDSAAKLLSDVFAPGDRWFRTGDLMRRDAAGYFYFVDRIGDTYRWKGENVSTSEVAAAISTCPGIAEVAVYGVRVPGTDGRAGMAAIVADPAFDLSSFRHELVRRMPAYARPLFLRICPEIELTATLRPRKQDLMRDGFDPAATGDALYFNDASRQAFLPLDAALFRRIVEGEMRL